MNQTKIFLGIIFAVATLSACTLRFGGTSQLPDAPAPTSIPLSEKAEGAPSTGLIPPQKQIALPPGFIIHVFAEGLNRPRMMAFGPDKSLYVAERGENRVVRLPDLDQNGTADQTQIVAEDLNSPSSLAFYRDGSLYIGETTQILRLSDPDESGVFQQRQVIIDGLPSGGHNTRTVLFSPEWNELYVSVGSSCNVCEETDPRRAAIVQYTPDGNEERIFASGLRNAVGITFRPGSDQLWATNNGRDMLGDDLPPETVYWVEEGQDYGWPACHAGRIIDPEYGDPSSCDDAGKPMIEMQAHSAPLGLTFYDGTQFPEMYHGGLFIAFHGSWNRSTPTGYKVVFVPFLQGNPGSVQDFATGWLTGNSSWGRPVDVIAAPDGSLYVSDDGGGRIFRIFYQGVQ